MEATMRSFLRSRRARWAVPAVAITGVAAAIAGGALLAGATSPELPERSPAELLAEIHEAEPQPFSGTLVQTSRLGLPDLPGLDGDRHETSLLSMLTGSNTARIWYASPEQARFALMGTFDETNVIRNGSDVWVWYSSSNTADHLVLPPGLDTGERPAMPHEPLTPAEAADKVLEKLDDSTAVTVDGTAEVAGRAAYELVFTPLDERTLIADVRLSIDAETSMPLRFEVNARDASDPAFEVGFTSVTFSEPSADTFRFNPPPGATVNERSLADFMAKEPGRLGGPAGLLAGPPEVVGEGWTSVLVVSDVPLPDLSGDDSGMLEALLGAGTTVAGPYGTGVMFETTLVSALWLADGTVLIGAVTPETLEAAAEAAR
jgi:outer membrane lipoprotein-sorting protein